MSAVLVIELPWSAEPGARAGARALDLGRGFRAELLESGFLSRLRERLSREIAVLERRPRLADGAILELYRRLRLRVLTEALVLPDVRREERGRWLDEYFFRLGEPGRVWAYAGDQAACDWRAVRAPGGLAAGSALADELFPAYLERALAGVGRGAALRVPLRRLDQLPFVAALATGLARRRHAGPVAIEGPLARDPWLGRTLRRLFPRAALRPGAPAARATLALSAASRGPLDERGQSALDRAAALAARGGRPRFDVTIEPGRGETGAAWAERKKREEQLGHVLRVLAEAEGAGRGASPVNARTVLRAARWFPVVSRFRVEALAEICSTSLDAEPYPLARRAVVRPGTALPRREPSTTALVPSTPLVFGPPAAGGPFWGALAHFASPRPARGFLARLSDPRRGLAYLETLVHAHALFEA